MPPLNRSDLGVAEVSFQPERPRLKMLGLKPTTLAYRMTSGQPNFRSCSPLRTRDLSEGAAAPFAARLSLVNEATCGAWFYNGGAPADRVLQVQSSPRRSARRRETISWQNNRRGRCRRCS